MPIQAQIVDGTGSKRKVKVTKDNKLLIITSPEPPIATQKTKPFRQYLTDDGLVSGSNDMGVDGSSPNIDYWVPACQDCDRYITQLSFIVGYGASGAPYLWADVAALTNGFRLFYTSLQGETDIHDGIKSNQDMFRLQFGLIQTLWEMRHVNANNDYGYFISMDLLKLVPPFGIKLDQGTTQKLIMQIRDNASDADSFNTIAYGFDRFE